MSDSLSETTNHRDRQGPAWDNSTEYPSLSSSELKVDLEQGRRLTEELAQLTARIAPLVAKAACLSDDELEQVVAWAQQASRVHEEAMILLSNVGTYASCAQSVDGRDQEAKTVGAKVQFLHAKLTQAWNPVRQFLKMTTDAGVERYLSSPHTASERFHVMRERSLRDQALSLAEEDLLIGLSVDGHAAWGTLYDNLSGTIACTLDLPSSSGETSRSVGLAEASSLLQSPHEDVRHAAYRAIHKGWETHAETVAAVLNALAGWRLEVAQRRSHTRPMHFLDEPLHQDNISRATLDAMMGAVAEVTEVAREGVKMQARLLGKERLGPWDLFAPCPDLPGVESEALSFAEGMQLVKSAFASIHPDMADFADMMQQKRWIEGRVGSHKRPGAYSTRFPKSRTTRVYMTYNGGMRELKTLAHEIGHSFHSWVMRDMPLVETEYPMTLAETASIFAETVVSGALHERAKTPGARLAQSWFAAREVESLLLNIPARFSFERAFYEKRREAPLNPGELTQLMEESWRQWYGDALSEMDGMFWASKLHFSLTGRSFYNYPYTFGYLFALGVYGQRATMGTEFYPAYVRLLRDTGRMTAEDLAAKHLGVDLTQPTFWRQSLSLATASLSEFQEAARVFL